MESVNQLFGSSVRERRVGLGLSQREAALKAGKTQAQLSDLERGAADVRLSTVIQLTRSLGADILIVPNELVPAVQALLSGVKPQESRLVGADPEDVLDDSAVSPIQQFWK